MTTSSIRHRGMLAALASLGTLGGMEPPRFSFRGSKTYPHDSKRQGERLERQMAKGLLDFSASERCIERIKARMEAKRG